MVAVLNSYAALLRKSKKPQAADELSKKAFSLLAIYSTNSADVPLKKTSKHSEKPDFTVVHPLLKIQACRPLGSVVLEPAIYKKLITFSIPGLNDPIISRSWGLEDQWEQYFGRAEADAAKRLGALAQGMTKAQLTELLGPPVRKMGQIDCWKPTLPRADHWIYKIGGSKILLCLSFVDAKCSDAKVCSMQESFDFDSWRVKKFCASALGKTVSQIIAANGKPDTCTDTEYWKTLLGITSSDARLEYTISKSCIVSLTIKKGICVKADEGWIAH